MEARELKDDELFDVTGGSSTTNFMYKHKYYDIYRSLPGGFKMDDVENAYKIVTNMYKKDCMDNDLTPEERNNLFIFIQNLNRIFQGKTAANTGTQLYNSGNIGEEFLVNVKQ